MGRRDPEEGQLPAPVKPPDGGWGWIVLLGCFVITGFSYAFPKAVSVYFKELMKDFHVGYSDTAWISSIMLAMLYGTGETWTQPSPAPHSAMGLDRVPMGSPHAQWLDPESTCRTHLSHHFSSRKCCILHSTFLCLRRPWGSLHLSLRQLTWGLLPVLKCCPYQTKPILFPGNRGLKGWQRRGLHAAASLPWPDLTAV